MAKWPSTGTTFGVEELLKQGATIYYSHDFRARSLGRVSDLLSACLKGRELHPLQLRAVLLHGLFAAYAAHGELNDDIPDIPPVSVEVGFDDEFTFLSIRFVSKEGVDLGLDDTIHTAETVSVPNRFREIVINLKEFCPALWVKRHPSNLSVELVIGFPRNTAELSSIFEIVEVTADALSTIDGKYIELGDAGFLQHLTQYVAKQDAESETVKKIMGQATEPDVSQEVKGSNESEDNSAQFVKGTDEPENDSTQKFNGTDEAEDDASQFVKGSSAGKVDESTVVLKGSEAEKPEAVHTIQGSEDAQRLREQTFELESRLARSAEELKRKDQEIARLKSELEKRAKSVEKTEPKEKPGFGDRLLKSIWPFNKPDPEEEVVVQQSRSDDAEGMETTVVSGDQENLDENSEFVVDSAEVPGMAGLEDSEFLKVDSRFNQVIQEMERDVRNEKAQAWNAALKAELMAEKSRLSDLHREISRQLKIKENGFRSREQALTTELKKREDLLRQKDLIIEQKSNQIASANLNLDKVKSGGGAIDDNGIKLKLTTTQKLAQMKEEENRVLVQKLKELENKLMVAQSKSSKTVDPQMMAKVQAAEKRVEEFKRMNQRLTESLQKAQEKRGEQDQAESKRKIENIERQWNESRKNLEKSEKKLKEVIESEGKLKVELGKTQEENRKMKQTLARLQPEDPENKNAA